MRVRPSPWGPEGLAVPSRSAEASSSALRSWHVVSEWLAGENPSQSWTMQCIRMDNEILGNVSASYKCLLEWLARQIHKCSLPLLLKNERELCETTTTRPFLWVDSSSQPEGKALLVPQSLGRAQRDAGERGKGCRGDGTCGRV